MPRQATIDPQPLVHQPVREATVADISALVALKQHVVDRTYFELRGPALEQWKQRFCTPEYFEERIGPDATFVVIESVAGEPCVQCKGRGSYPPHTRQVCNRCNAKRVEPESAPIAVGALKLRDGKGYVGDIYCFAKGDGIGDEIHDRLVELAAAADVDTLVADVFSTNEHATGWMSNHLGYRPVSGYQEQSLGVWVWRYERPVHPDETASPATGDSQTILTPPPHVPFGFPVSAELVDFLRQSVYGTLYADALDRAAQHGAYWQAWIKMAEDETGTVPADHRFAKIVLATGPLAGAELENVPAKLLAMPAA